MKQSLTAPLRSSLGKLVEALTLPASSDRLDHFLAEVRRATRADAAAVLRRGARVRVAAADGAWPPGGASVLAEVAPRRPGMTLGAASARAPHVALDWLGAGSAVLAGVPGTQEPATLLVISWRRARFPGRALRDYGHAAAALLSLVLAPTDGIGVARETAAPASSEGVSGGQHDSPPRLGEGSRSGGSGQSAQLQRALRRAAEEWRLTFDSIDEMLIVLGPEGHIERLNRAAAAASGRSPLDVIGLRVDDLGDTEPWRALRLLRSGEEGTHRTHDHADGRTWLVSVKRLAPYGGDGPRVIATARDVSQAIRLEAALRRAEAMSTLGALVAGVAHQVRNPLFAITSLLAELSQDIGTSYILSEYLPRLNEESDRLQRLMRELLEYGRPTPLERRLQQLPPLVDEAARLVGGTASERDVSVRLEEAGELPPVPAQPDRLVEAFEILLQNAVQFSPPGASIVVRLEQLSEGGARRVACSVADSGPGFPGDALDQVFEPFFTRRRGGTGLGLALAKRIVEDHGGTVRAANRDGGGGLVEILLPAAEPATP